MSCLAIEIMSPKQTWKGRSGKIKRGKPTGPREVIEKYKAVRPGFLEWHNHKQHWVYDLALGSGFSCKCCRAGAKRKHYRNMQELRSMALADAEDYLLERAEQEACREPTRVVQQEQQENQDVVQDQAGDQTGAVDVQTVDPALARAWARSLRASPSTYQLTRE
ncbi:hypothetical protein KVR01_003215 [Diaporthe batatas]|uniref:uncharacterized protein n=1 Tax=Diaporthe batatas TaxID=748121 RepID=UPI001D04D3DB|nr:uncharacterized protein KVR01_003215 [Diaporthe batatas]KAG8167526.1 hypothetical protein KVR01_003215 [Diaporthe batatas]